MQDVQNIPNPDVNSNVTEDDFDSHPRNQDIERPGGDAPVPLDAERSAPIEEPPTEQDKPPIEEDDTAPKMLV